MNFFFFSTVALDSIIHPNSKKPTPFGVGFAAFMGELTLMMGMKMGDFEGELKVIAMSAIVLKQLFKYQECDIMKTM